ncbi:MAG: hypothetical protein M3384_08960 [Acidobacteriota bacterium]|nr:hypothetical protein [Acidobacteriota bacterium]
MFIGHYAVGFAAKRFAPKTNLGWLIAAPLLLDLIWAPFVLTGIERVRIEPGNTAFTPLAFDYYPYSHSLLTAVGWSVIFALVYYAFSRYKTGAIVIGIGVLSHWIMDAVVHRPDLPPYPGCEDFVGFGLWNSIVATIVVEGILFLAGVFIYRKTTAAKDKIGGIGFWAFVAVLILIYAGNILSPPPPSVTVIAWVALAVVIFPIAAGWIDSHRETAADKAQDARL